MILNVPTFVTALLCVVGVLLAVPVLVKGFCRRGTGIRYENDFLIQRAPQYASLINLLCITLSFLVFNHISRLLNGLTFLSAIDFLPGSVGLIFSFVGILLQISGFIFMVGGWYNLGEYFSTDAEVLKEHKVKATGLFGLVMHPIYSGIIQTLLGLSITALSPLSTGITLFLVAPLWLNRARCEERILLENLGDAYSQYAAQMKWRRIIPLCLPFGF